jgi:DNA-3-methyladenine glycosylase II
MVFHNLIFINLQMHYFKLLQADKKLSKIIKKPAHELTYHKNIPLRLMRSIVSQQLSTKVAEVIYGRFIQLYNGKDPKPQQVLDTPIEKLRTVGLSNSKATYLHNIAAFCIQHKITDKMLLAMQSHQIQELLTQIKGVGTWTVEMLLMFTLGREDEFPLDDLGIQQAMTKLYNIKYENKKELQFKMEKIAKSWSPYRTYACLHLWAWKDGE